MFRKPFDRRMGMTALLCLTLFLALDTQGKDAQGMEDVLLRGPVSPTEESLLRLKGQEAFGQGNYPEAVLYLRRFIHRYPGSRGYLDAHLLLGMSYLRMSEARSAIDPLKYFVEALGRSMESVRARIPLGEAYLGAKKYHEALLVSREIVENKIRKKVPDEVHLEGLLLKTWALLGLDDEFRAKRTLGSFQDRISKTQSASSLVAQGHRLALELKLRNCEKLPTKGAMGEDQVRDQLRRRGICLKEGLVLYRDILKEQNNRWEKDARNALAKAYAAYGDVCVKPPAPKEKRSPIELKRYREELTSILIQDCDQVREDARKLLRSWVDGEHTADRKPIEALLQLI